MRPALDGRRAGWHSPAGGTRRWCWPWRRTSPGARACPSRSRSRRVFPDVSRSGRDGTGRSGSSDTWASATGTGSPSTTSSTSWDRMRRRTSASTASCGRRRSPATSPCSNRSTKGHCSTARGATRCWGGRRTASRLWAAWSAARDRFAGDGRSRPRPRSLRPGSGPNTFADASNGQPTPWLRPVAPSELVETSVQLRARPTTRRSPPASAWSRGADPSLGGPEPTDPRRPERRRVDEPAAAPRGRPCTRPRRRPPRAGRPHGRDAGAGRRICSRTTSSPAPTRPRSHVATWVGPRRNLRPAGPASASMTGSSILDELPPNVAVHAHRTDRGAAPGGLAGDEPLDGRDRRHEIVTEHG